MRTKKVAAHRQQKLLKESQKESRNGEPANHVSQSRHQQKRECANRWYAKNVGRNKTA